MKAGQNRPALAAALVVSGMALFGLIDNFMRLASEEGGLWQFHFLRAAIALAVLFPMARALGARLRPLRPPQVFARSALNSLAMVSYFGALGVMPTAQVVAGLFTAPLFVVLFSVILFRDRVGPWQVGAVALGFTGILLALRLDAADLSPLVLLPVLAGAFYGLGNLVTRNGARTKGPWPCSAASSG